MESQAESAELSISAAAYNKVAGMPQLKSCIGNNCINP